MQRLQQFLSLSILIAAATPLSGDVHHVNVDRIIQGTWTANSNNTMASQEDQFGIDFDEDGTFEISLAHAYELNPNHIHQEGFDLAIASLSGLNHIRNEILAIRGHVRDSFHTPLNDADDLILSQFRIDQKMEAIDQFTQTHRFDTQFLFNGASGSAGVPSSQNLTFLTATEETSPGSYKINITEPSHRASMSLGLIDFFLFVDQELILNRTTIPLYAGMTANQTRDQINRFREATGVFAFLNQEHELMIASNLYGSNATFEVSSNLPLDINDAIAIGTKPRTKAGSNGTVEVDGQTVELNGQVATVANGLAQGLSFLVEEDANRPLQTVAGSSGLLTVHDGSLQLQLRNSNDIARLSIPRLLSSSIGLGVPNNRFSNLAEIDITSRNKATDSLAVVERATGDIDQVMDHVHSVLNEHYLPMPSATVEALAEAGIAIDGDSLYPFDSTIGEETNFTQQLSADSTWQAGYIGLQVRLEDGVHYGWARVVTENDESIRLRSYAFETEPGVSILTGRIPGDFDADVRLTAADIDRLTLAIQNEQTDPAFDLNNDGNVDRADHENWVHDRAQTIYGDSNLDGRFNTNDLIKVFQFGQYEDTIERNSTWTSGDWNGDLEFDSTDLVAAFKDGGFERNSNVANKVVPEPNSNAWFVLITVLALCGARRLQP